jgi:hypothetical protein
MLNDGVWWMMFARHLMKETSVQLSFWSLIDQTGASSHGAFPTRRVHHEGAMGTRGDWTVPSCSPSARRDGPRSAICREAPGLVPFCR